MIGGTQILIILLVILLLFGARKLPELGKGLGRGIKSFKEGLHTDEVVDAELPEGEKKESDSEKQIPS